MEQQLTIQTPTLAARLRAAVSSIWRALRTERTRPASDVEVLHIAEALRRGRWKP